MRILSPTSPCIVQSFGMRLMMLYATEARKRRDVLGTWLNAPVPHGLVLFSTCDCRCCFVQSFGMPLWCSLRKTMTSVSSDNVRSCPCVCPELLEPDASLGSSSLCANSCAVYSDLVSPAAANGNDVLRPQDKILVSGETAPVRHRLLAHVALCKTVATIGVNLN